MQQCYLCKSARPIGEEKIIAQQIQNIRQAKAKYGISAPGPIREEDNPHPITLQECKLTKSQELLRYFMSLF